MIVIDTHILIWWVSQDKRLSDNALGHIQHTINAGSAVVISSISVWEIAMLIQKQRLSLTMDTEMWVDKVNHIEGVQFLAVDNDIAIKSTLLPGDFHKDPADRIIVATARKLGVPLITADQKIQDYPHVKTLY